MLVNDAAYLQDAYPGGNAIEIGKKQRIVVDNWSILQEKVQQRKADLLAAEDLFRFLNNVSDSFLFRNVFNLNFTCEHVCFIRLR